MFEGIWEIKTVDGNWDPVSKNNVLRYVESC